MAGQSQPYTFDRVIRLVLSAAALVALFLLLRHLSDVLLPFAAAVVLAYLLNPLVTLFERKTGRRGLGVAITLSGLTMIGFALIVLLVPLTLKQFDRFRNDLQKLADDVAGSIVAARIAPDSARQHVSREPEETETAVDLSSKTTLGWRELLEGWEDYRRDAPVQSRRERIAELRDGLSGTYVGQGVDALITYAQSDEFRGFLVNAAKKLAAGGWSVLTFTVNLLIGLTGLIIVLLYLVFLLLDFPEYARTWPSFLPPQYREATVEFFQQFNLAMRRYFRGQSVISLLSGAMLATGFTIIGLPMAVPFGLFVGLLNMVPYLASVSIVPGIMLAGLRAIESDAGFFGSVLLLLSVYVVVQVIQDGFLTPRIMGKATGLRPIAVLLGIFVWGKLLGFLGLILAIPLTCLGIAYYRRYILVHEAKPG